MRKTKTKEKFRIFTIGHSNHSMDTFLGLLKKHQIEVLIDTRSHPNSRHVPHFATDILKAAASEAGLKYLFLGKELGGRPEGSQFYDSEGRVLYWRRASSADFKEGIRSLEDELQKHRVAILCSEEDPSCCHRRLLVGYVLTRHGIILEHIRGDGRVDQEEKVQTVDKQKSLFGEQGKQTWRSIQSVLQRGRQPNSLEH